MRSNQKTPREGRCEKERQKEGKEQQETGRKIELKTTGNEVEWDAMKQSAQFPFCQRRTIFLSQVCLLDCHWGDGLRPWLTCLSRPLACWPSKTILVIVPCSLCSKIFAWTHLEDPWLGGSRLLSTWRILGLVLWCHMVLCSYLHHSFHLGPRCDHRLITAPGNANICHQNPPGIVTGPTGLHICHLLNQFISNLWLLLAPLFLPWVFRHWLWGWILQSKSDQNQKRKLGHDQNKSQHVPFQTGPLIFHVPSFEALPWL